MTGWWRRARVMSAMGAGTLVLGGGSAVYAIKAGESAASPPDAMGTDRLTPLSRWGRAGDVVRF
ncbi:hypothetical protein, partial [Streptomyces anulatus]|uniref:hypothetical protein n=1 Tax=Streptomyces anulatus TaxID=1892 RepID=UPI00342AADD3